MDAVPAPTPVLAPSSSLLSPSSGLPRQVQAAEILRKAGKSYKIPKVTKVAQGSKEQDRGRDRIRQQNDDEADSDERSRSGSGERSAEEVDEAERALTPEETRRANKFSTRVEPLTSTLVGVVAATPAGHAKYPDEEPSSRGTLLPPHVSVKQWYDFAETTMKRSDTAEKGTPYDCPSQARFARLYNTGKEGEFLLHPRRAPSKYKEISSFTSSKAVKDQLGLPLTLSKKMVKTVDKQVLRAVGNVLRQAFCRWYIDCLPRSTYEVADFGSLS